MRPLRRQIPDRNRAGRRGVGESGVPLRPQGPRAGVARGGVRAGRAGHPPGSCLSNVAFRTFERLGGSGVCRRGACSHSVLRERFNRVTPPGACRAASAVRTSPSESRCSASVPLPGRPPRACLGSSSAVRWRSRPTLGRLAAPRCRSPLCAALLLKFAAAL